MKGKPFLHEGSMDTNVATIQLLKDLYASETGLLPYTLYRRYGVTPVELVQIVKRLQASAVVQLTGGHRMSLTKTGRENIDSLIASLTPKKKEEKESAYFVRIKSNKIGRRIPFMPSKHFFELLEKEGVRNV